MNRRALADRSLGNSLQASKRLAHGALLADLAGERLNEYIDATVKGAARAIFAAKVVVVVTSIIEDAFTVLRSYARASGEHLTDVARRLMTDRHSRTVLVAAISEFAVPPTH